MYTVIYIHIYMYTHTETEVRPFFPQRGRGGRFPLEYVDNCPCGGGTKPALGSGKPSPAPAAAAPRTYPCGPRCRAPPSPAAAAPPQRTHIRGRRLLRPAAGGSGWAALPGREAGPGGQPRRGSPPGAARARSTSSAGAGDAGPGSALPPPFLSLPAAGERGGGGGLRALPAAPRPGRPPRRHGALGSGAVAAAAEEAVGPRRRLRALPRLLPHQHLQAGQCPPTEPPVKTSQSPGVTRVLQVLALSSWDRIAS